GDSNGEAQPRAELAAITNVLFRQADIFALPFSAESFDHIFVCFVLEHLERPVEALAILGRLLRAGGTITLIEGDHGSTYFYPDQRSGPRGDTVPNHAAASRRRECTDWPTDLSAAGRGWLRHGSCLSTDGLRRSEPT